MQRPCARADSRCDDCQSLRRKRAELLLVAAALCCEGKGAPSIVLCSEVTEVAFRFQKESSATDSNVTSRAAEGRQIPNIGYYQAQSRAYNQAGKRAGQVQYCRSGIPTSEEAPSYETVNSPVRSPSQCFGCLRLIESGKTKGSTKDKGKREKECFRGLEEYN